MYNLRCSNCHMEDGQGVANLVPAIKPTRFVNERKGLICLMISGAKDSISGFDMPSFEKMTNTQIANVLNYINTKQKFAGAFFNENEIETYRKDCSNQSIK